MWRRRPTHSNTSTATKRLERRYPMYKYLLAAALCTVAFQATAGDRFTAQGAFCDTADTATDFVKNFNGKNARETIDTVNKKAGSTACALGRVILEEVERTTSLTNELGTWQLVKLHVWGADAGGGMMLAFTQPLTQWTYIKVEGPTLGQAI